MRIMRMSSHRWWRKATASHPGPIPRTCKAFWRSAPPVAGCWTTEQTPTRLGTPRSWPYSSTISRRPPPVPNTCYSRCPTISSCCRRASGSYRIRRPRRALTPNPDGSVTVNGTGLSANSQVFFDSLPGQSTPPAATNQSDPSGQSGSVSVMPPPGASGQTAAITVYNPDGQNSTFLDSQTQSPFIYVYPQSNRPAAAISISQLPQGMSAMVTITTSTMQFVDGLTTLGFGSGDVAVRRLWVRSPTLAIANITVSPSALERETVASVISGFQVYEQALGFQVVPAIPNLPVIGLPVTSAFYPEQNSLYPGSIASMYGRNLEAATSTPAITVPGQSAQIKYTSPTQINFVIPVGVPIGPAVLTLQGALPIVVQIDPPPPVIVGAASVAGLALGASESAAPGDTITLTVSGMDPAVVSVPSRVELTEGGVSIPAFTIQQAQDGSGDLLIQFALTASVTGQQGPVVVSLDGDLSKPFSINVAAPAAIGSN